MTPDAANALAWCALYVALVLAWWGVFGPVRVGWGWTW